MLDTYGRKYVNVYIDWIAEKFLKMGLSPNQVTISALIIGCSTFAFITLEQNVLACVCLWVSGLLDAVDGAMARKSKASTPWGTLMDITFDRMVELSVLLSLALKFPSARFSIILLLCAILLSMTVFLTVGALVNQKGIKSFHYQAGLAERTEGFIFLTLMILFTNQLVFITLAFAFLVIITALQRFIEAYKILK